MGRGEEEVVGGGRCNLKILDTSVLIDGRILDVAQTGFLEGIVPSCPVSSFSSFSLSPIPPILVRRSGDGEASTSSTASEDRVRPGGDRRRLPSGSSRWNPSTRGLNALARQIGGILTTDY